MIKKLTILLLIGFLILQFFGPELPEVINKNPKDLITNNPDIPEDIKTILQVSCYDCHSNETTYPWYSNIAPGSFLVARDINHARDDLNFSNWEDMNKLDKASALDEITDVIIDDEMPMAIYTAMHRGASLSDQQKELLVSWTEEFSDQMFD